MKVGVIGINHKKADICLREKIVKEINKPLKIFSFPTILLQTCNRVEIYFSAHDLSVAAKRILQIFKEIESEQIVEKTYIFFEKECFSHLCKVTAGTDSAIYGESEIQRQVKLAYYEMTKKQLLPSALHYLFQKSLKIAKEIRTSLIEKKELQKILLDTVTCLYPTFKEASFLFIGNSAINRATLPLFYQKGVRKLTLCTREVKSAELFYASYGCAVFNFEKIADWPNFDIIICATNFSTYLIKSQPTYKSSLIFDLSVPRCVDPVLSGTSKISLFNIDTLNGFFEKKKEVLWESKLYSLIEENVERLYSIFQTKRLLKLSMTRIAGEGDYISNVFHSGNKLNQSFKAQTKTTMGNASIFS